MRNLVDQILYSDTPNIALPSLQLPLQNKQLERWSEKLTPELLLDDTNYIHFNQYSEQKKPPLRHNFFFTGLNSVRQVESESAD